MNMVLSILCVASGVLAGAAGGGRPGDADGPPVVSVTNDGSSSAPERTQGPEPARDCLVWARLHVTQCTNALDGSPSIISNSLCADGCGNSYEEAATAAYYSMSTQTCLGPTWGCCDFYIDANFNVCGG